MTLEEKENQSLLLEELKESQKLLTIFNVRLLAFDPGVVGFLMSNPDGPSLDFSGFEWKWLKPLLIELRDFRNKKL